MNIVEFLIEDHEALREERFEIQETLAEEVVKKKIGRYIAHFELHETIEDKFLFPELMPTLPNMAQAKFVTRFRKDHEKIWNFLVELHEDIKIKDIPSLQKNFRSFFTFVEIHIAKEENGLFPAARRLLGSQILEELGEKVRRYRQRYRPVLEGCKE